MAAEHRPTESRVGTGVDTETAARRRSAVLASFDRQRPVTAGERGPTESPLYARIERRRLEFRVRALERALETSERRRQAVIDRYERLLADRTASADDASTSDEAERSGTLLTRLLER